MAKRFTRNIRSIENIEKQPKYTNEQNDLLSDDKHVYVRNKDQYEQITGGVKEVNGETPDENGNVNLQIKDFKEQEKLVRKNQLDEALEGIESSYKQYTDNRVDNIDISDTNLLAGTSDSWIEETWSSWGSQRQDFYIGEGSLKIGDTLTYSIEIDNTVDDVNDTSVLARLSFYDNKDNLMSNQSKSGNYINGGEKGTSVVTDKIPEGAKRLAIFYFYKNGGSEEKTAKARKHKLQYGTRATPWTPASEDLVDEAKNYTDKAFEDIDINNRNLLTGTSDEWEERTFSKWVPYYIHLRLKDVGLQPGDIFTYGVDIDNTIDKVNTSKVRSSITFRDSNDNQIDQISTNYISSGKKERAMFTTEIPEKTSVIRIAKFNKIKGKKQKTSAVRKTMLNYGTRAAPWTPAPEDIVLKSELEKIKQAIINLGGSI